MFALGAMKTEICFTCFRPRLFCRCTGGAR